MISYKPSDWWTAPWRFHTTKVLNALIGRVAVVRLCVVLAAAAQLEYFHFIFKVKRDYRDYFSFMGILMSLLLVF